MRLLSRKSVATLLDVSEKTVHRWVAEGALPPPVYLPNGDPRWHESIVMMWVACRPATRPDKSEEGEKTPPAAGGVKKKTPGQSRTEPDRAGQMAAAPGPPEK